MCNNESEPHQVDEEVNIFNVLVSFSSYFHLDHNYVNQTHFNKCV